MFGIKADADPPARYIGATGSAQGIGVTLEPAAAGLIISGTDYTNAALLCNRNPAYGDMI